MGKRVALGIGVLVLALAFLPGIRRLWDPGSQAPSESLVVDVVPAGRASIPPGPPERRVTDYLAGMTDRFCIRAFEALSMPVAFAP